MRPRPRYAVADDDPRGARQALIQYLGDDADIREDVRGNDKGPINVSDLELSKRAVQGRQNEGSDVEQQYAAKIVAVPAPEGVFRTKVVIIAIAGGPRRYRSHIVDGVVLW